MIKTAANLRWLSQIGLLAMLGLLLLATGCCPYTKGILADVSTSTTMSKADSFEYLQRWFDDSGYKIWQQDAAKGYVRASTLRQSGSGEVEDVLAATLSDTGGKVKVEIQAETYSTEGRRQKIKVSDQAKQDMNSIKAALARGGVGG